PSHPQTILATPGSTPPALLRSINGGDTWGIIGQGQFGSNAQINGVTVDSLGRIYVACSAGFYVSEDAGQTFRNIASGAPAGASFGDVMFYDEGQNSFAIFAAVIDPAGVNNATGVWQITPSGGGYQWAQVPFTLRNLNNA